MVDFWFTRADPNSVRNSVHSVSESGSQLKIEAQKEKKPSIKINPYDNLSLSRRFIDKKNKQVGIFDLGNHILIIGMIISLIFILINID